MYDLIVIGAGAAGLAAADVGAAAKVRTLLVAEGEPGGECTFTGCVPSKTLIEAAGRGVGFGEAIGAVHRAVSTIARTESAEVLARRGIEVLRGHATFTAAHRITVAGRTMEARGIVVATGSKPTVPPVPGLIDSGFLTTDTVFDLTELPASMAVLGGGAVGCELAQAFARLGSRVTLVEAAPRLLPAADPAASRVIERALTEAGVSVRTGCVLDRVDARPAGRGCALHLPGSGLVVADALLVATGRAPVTDRLDLPAAGVETDRRGAVIVDRHMATTARGVYAAGDCTGAFPFTHAAYAMGRIAARNALRRPGRPADRFVIHAIPRVVYTDPEVAQVGLTEQRAADVRGSRVVYLSMRNVDRAVTAGRTEGFIKLIAGPRPVTGNLGGGRLLGATIVASRAGEMIDEIALAMRVGVFTGRLAQTTHAYPTWSLAIQQAAAGFFTGSRGWPARREQAAEDPA